jgi:hypothetical protein
LFKAPDLAHYTGSQTDLSENAVVGRKISP